MEGTSRSLLPLSVAFFNKYQYTDGQINSFDQALLSIDNILTNHARKKVVDISQSGEKIEVEIWFSDIKYTDATQISGRQRFIPLLPTQAIQLGKTYGVILSADLNIKLSLLRTKREYADELTQSFNKLLGIQTEKHFTKRDPILLKQQDVFNTIIPIPVKSKHCILRMLTPRQAHESGEDFTSEGGWFVIEGAPKTIGSVYSHIFNIPTTINVTGHADQIIRTDIMFQKDHNYGVSYQVVPMIIKDTVKLEFGSQKKTTVYDIVIVFRGFKSDMKQTDDPKLLDRYNKIPIRALFFIYGCINDLQIANYVFPGEHKPADALAFLRSVLLRGTVHAKLPAALTASSAYLHIANEIMSDNAKNNLYERVKAAAALYTRDNPAIKSDVVELMFKHQKIEWAKELMSFFMINANHDNEKVCIILGNLVRQLINVKLGTQPETDRNSLANRRVHQIGEQYLKEFHIAFNAMVMHELTMTARKMITDLTFDSLKNEILAKIQNKVSDRIPAFERQMHKAFRAATTGRPNLLAEQMSYKSILFHLSKMREISIRPNPGERQDSVTYQQRQVHPSHACFLCPSQTPEAGTDVGRYHQPALYTLFSLVLDNGGILEFLEKYPKFTSKMPSHEKVADYYAVNLNGTIIGVVPRGDEPDKLWRALLEKRRTDERIDYFTGISIHHDRQAIDIYTDSGRPCTPLIRASMIDHSDFKNWLQLLAANKMTWDEALHKGIIEWIDANMMDNCIVAPSLEAFYAGGKQFTHIMLPCGGAGLISSVSPGFDRKLAVRSIYETNQVKQSVSQILHNVMTMGLSEVNLLLHPQRPLVRSAFYDIFKLFRHAYGEHVIICAMSSAANQEDAIIVNLGAVDRGWAKSVHVVAKTYKIESKNTFFGLKPYNELASPVAPEKAYKKIDPRTGIVTQVGVEITGDDVIVAKYREFTAEEKEHEARIGGTRKYKDESEKFPYSSSPNARHPSTAQLVSVNLGSTAEEDRKSLTLAIIRYPVVGDKFSTEAQKSIVTEMRLDEDMPFTADGLRPTIVFNPPPILRRGTPSYIYNSLVGKVCALLGCSIQSTPFLDGIDHVEAMKILADIGLSDGGDEVVYDGVSGKPYKSRIFVGVNYYNRLRHMVRDKMFARYRGPREAYSQQATHGRKGGKAGKSGGLKIGTMENDAIRASGASAVHRDCLYYQSAPSNVWICDRCNNLAYPSTTNPGVIHCDKCGDLTTVKGHHMNSHYNVKVLRNIYSGAGISLDTIVN